MGEGSGWDAGAYAPLVLSMNSTLTAKRVACCSVQVDTRTRGPAVRQMSICPSNIHCKFTNFVTPSMCMP